MEIINKTNRKKMRKFHNHETCDTKNLIQIYSSKTNKDGTIEMQVETHGKMEVEDVTNRIGTNYMFKLIKIKKQRESKGTWIDGIVTIGIFEML